MNKDLAVVPAVWRALFGGAVSPLLTTSNRLLSTYRLLVEEPPKMVLRRMMGPSLETGTVLDAALSVNYCRIAIRCL